MNKTGSHSGLNNCDNDLKNILTTWNHSPSTEWNKDVPLTLTSHLQYYQTLISPELSVKAHHNTVSLSVRSKAWWAIKRRDPHYCGCTTAIDKNR